MNGFGRYLLSVSALAVLATAVLAAFVIAVDPMGYFGNRLDRFHYPEGRGPKAALMRAPANDVLYFASSMSSSFQSADFPALRIVNVGESGLRPEEIRYMLERRGAGKRMVIIGVDPYTSVQATWVAEPDYAHYSVKGVVDNALSLAMLRSALASLVHDWRGHAPRMGSDGSRAVPWEVATTGMEVAQRTVRTYDNDEYRRSIAAALGGWEGKPNRLGVFRDIRDLLARQGTSCVVFFQPLNEDVLARIKDDPVRLRLWTDFKRGLREIFPATVDMSEGAFSSRDHFYPFDAVHYNRATAIEVMARAVAEGATGGPCPLK